MPFLITEAPPTDRSAFNPRGAAREFWRCRSHEVMLSGPAETGKTFTCCHKLDALLWKYPRSRAVMLRKTQTSLYGTVLATYRKIVGTETPIKFYGGEKPEWADYPNGSRLYFAGMDNPQKALSSERDFIYANQAEELALADWEVLTTRCTGRAANAPYAQILGDCNPGPPNHWIKHRPSLRVFESRHEDNPTLYDEAGVITERGRLAMEVLDALSGIRYLRLRKGLWVGGEGQWFNHYDPDRHITENAEYSPNLDVVLAMDSGVHTGAVFYQVKETPIDEIVTVFADYYAEGLTVEENAREILAIAAERCGGVIHKALTDPSGGDRNPTGPAVIELYEKAGLSLGKWIKGPGSVLDGLAIIEDYLGSPTVTPRLFLHPRCQHMSSAFANYSRAQRAGQWIDKPQDPQHPYEDLMDSLRGGLYRPATKMTWGASPVSGAWRG